MSNSFFTLKLTCYLGKTVVLFIGKKINHVHLSYFLH